MAAAQKIGYANKQSGSLWTSSNANEVKDVVNSHADTLDNFAQSLQTEHTEVLNVKNTVQQHGTAIGARAKFVQSTEEEIAAMNTAETWEEGTFYYTVEA